MDLSAGQSERDGTTISVNGGMDLAREAASGTAHAAIIGSPFLPVAPCWWARTQVESIITISPSKAAETAASTPERVRMTGKLFEDSGESITPTFSKRSIGKFYRYYVSASLQQDGKPADDGIIPRVSGPAIERVLAEIIIGLVPSCPAPLNLPTAVRLSQDGLLIDLPGKLAFDIASRLSLGETIIHMDRETVRIRVALAFPLRGGKRTVLAGRTRSANPDLKLIAALRRANRIIHRLRGMPFISTAPVSTHELKILRLAFLAPDLQRDILAGHQPRSINLERLRQIEIPLSWKEQRKVLGWSISSCL